MKFPHKNIRLPKENYRGQRWYFITICTEGRRPFLATAERTSGLIAALRHCAATHRFSVHAYCVMPDHFHALLEGLDPASDLLRLATAFKRSTTAQHQKHNTGPLWQKKFYDHIVRRAEDAEPIAWYIWMNPVRRNLCRSVEEYPYAGSFSLPWPPAGSRAQEWTPPWKRS